MMGRRRRERRDDRQDDRRGGGGMNKYQMREKLVSIGNDFWIENAAGQKTFKVDGKAMRVRDTLKFEDAHGKELCKIQEKKVRVKDTMNIEGPGGETLATVKKALITPVRDRWTIKVGKKGYEMAVNPDFGKDLLARFNPKTDTLLFLCRSGSRSCISSTEAVKAGFTEDKVFNIMGGFEGGKMKYKSSACCGKRIGGSWKNEGLPWTYHMDKRLMYQPDVAE